MAEAKKKEWRTQLYSEQNDFIWPKEGNHILAQFDEDSIIVYQAYCPEIAEYAVKNQRLIINCTIAKFCKQKRFGGALFSYNRMSWIKTNFLWMMYRSGWANKPNQERVLAIRITRDAFNTILANALTG